METFVLIHGAWHGAWSWEKVIPLLEKAGHRAIALDLPGHGKDRGMPPAEVTMQNCTDSVLAVLDKQPEPVILVGHSMGGMIISQTAEYRPEKIKRLVYVCAFLLKDGESLRSKGGGRHHPETDIEFKELFYHDCPDEVFQWARAQFVGRALTLAVTPIHITDRNYGRVPRVYIECLRDKAIPASLQKQMYTEMPCDRVITMNTGHCPLLAAPEELVKNLLSVIPAWKPLFNPG